MAKVDLITKGTALAIVVSVSVKEATNIEGLKEIYDMLNAVCNAVQSRIKELKSQPSPNQLPLL